MTTQAPPEDGGPGWWRERAGKHLIKAVAARILARNRHVRLLYTNEIAGVAIVATLKEIRLYAGPGPHGDAIAKWIDGWIAEIEAMG